MMRHRRGRNLIDTRSVFIGITTALLVCNGASGQGTPPAQAGWPKCFLAGPITLADVCGDADLEIVAAGGILSTGQGGVFVFKADGSLAPGWPCLITQSVSRHALPVGDVTGNGSPEIVFATGDGTVYVCDSTGNLVPGWPQWFIFADSFALGDLDGDGDMEIVVRQSSFSSFNLLAFHGNGSVVAGWPVNISVSGGFFGSGLAVADLDLDGTYEVIPGFVRQSTAANTPVRVYNGDGTMRSSWPIASQDCCLRQPVVADLVGGDHACELVGLDEGILVGRDMDGFALWAPVAVPSTTALAVGDVTGDGNLDIVTHGLRLGVYSSGSLVSTSSGDGYSYQQAVIADTDGDGKDEILALSTRYISPTGGSVDQLLLHRLDENLVEHPGYPVLLDPLEQEHPFVSLAVDDLDRDGDVEVVCSTRPNSPNTASSQIIVLDMPAALGPASTSWGGARSRGQNQFQFYEDYPIGHYLRGDADRDNTLTVADAVAILREVFGLVAAPTRCPGQCDYQADGSVDIDDALSLIDYLFLGGSPPSAPFPTCQPVPSTERCFEFVCGEQWGG